MTYQGQYCTINSSISECDHKCETRNAEPEIRTDGSSQTWRNPQVDGYRSRFGPPRVCGSSLWSVLEPNQPVIAVQTRTAGGLPGPVANTNEAPYEMPYEMLHGFGKPTQIDKRSKSHMHEAPDEEAENAHSWRLRREDQTAQRSAANAENIAHSRRLRREDQTARRSAAAIKKSS